MPEIAHTNCWHVIGKALLKISDISFVLFDFHPSEKLEMRASFFYCFVPISLYPNYGGCICIRVNVHIQFNRSSANDAGEEKQFAVLSIEFALFYMHFGVVLISFSVHRNTSSDIYSLAQLFRAFYSAAYQYDAVMNVRAKWRTNDKMMDRESS